MLLNLHSLSSQKKGAAFSFVLAVVVAALVMALFAFATSGPSVPQQFTPRWVMASGVNATINVTVTNVAGATVSVQRVDIANTAITAVDCPASDKWPSGWACTKVSATVSYQNEVSPLAAGSSANFAVNITPPAGGGNKSFTITSYQTTSGGEINTTGTAGYAGNVNVSVDNDFPFVQLMNISARRSDGTRISINGAQTNGLFFLPNTSDGYVFVINASDNASGMDTGRVTLYYNISTLGNDIVNLIDYRNASVTNVSSFQASNGSVGGPLSLYNVTLNISSMASLNGTRIAFILLANDSVGNGNVSNSSNASAVSTFVYNFTIDAVAPQFVDVQISNQSINTTTAIAINTTKTWGSSVEYILNSSLILNVSALVRDDGGAGTVKVEVMDRTGAFLNMNLLTGANGSTGSTTWALNSSPLNISDLVKGFAGDGLYNLTFRATDNVSNANSTYNFTVEVDDTPPKGSATTNISVNGVLSAGNVTISTLINGTLINTSINITLQTNSNINNVTRNVSVYGNKEGNIFNMSYYAGTPSGTSYWNLSLSYNDVMNSSALCDLAVTDGTQCNLRFNFTDVMGRENTSINLTIAVDGLAPNVSILSPVSLTTNYTGLALINVSINDTVGPIQNVSFRIVNRNNFTIISLTSEGFYNATHANITNMTNWIPMSLGTGSNTQFLTNGTWNYTINLTALNFSDGNYTIEINVTDSAGRQNVSVNRSNLIFDSTPPQNISILTPATNSFWNANFTVNLNATEQASGLLNVTVRLENGTHNSPWVGVQQAFPSALSSVTNVGETVRFNITAFNITHIGNGMLDNITLNATNGNFTLRLNVTDTAGNQNTSVTINFTIDTIVPAVAFVYPVNNRNQTGNFTVNASVIESNVNTVRFRWENGTITNGNSNNGSFNNPMTYSAAESRANATFTNLTDGSPPLLFDSNYTIRLNVTDKAGNINDTVYIQLVLDKTPAKVVAQFPANNSIQTGNFLVNMTFNDNLTVAGTSAASVVNSSNINSSAYRLENNTFNGSWIGMPNVSTDFAVGNVDRNRTNATFTFADVANGRYDIRFWVNDTAGNQNSSVLITNVTLDNVAPSVAFSVLNLTPAASGGTGVTSNISFNATVTDNLPLNISITNNTNAQGQQYGVFFRIENSSMNNSNASWLPMSTISFNNFEQNNTGVEHSAIFNLTNNATILYADGDYTIRINATDRAGNQNTSVSISFIIQNGGSKVRATNLTFQGGYITGSDTNQTSPTFLVNTTTNSTCLYSIDTPVTNYDYFLPQTTSNTMGNNVSRQHITPLGFRPDRAANGYSTYYVCRDVGGNFTGLDGVTSTFTFGVDTRNFFNITMGSAGTNKVRGDYFAVGWNSFTLPKTTLLANTGVPTNYNVTNVLSSLGDSRLATANFTVVFAYNGSAWASYRVGTADNTFSNFTADTTATYYINITAANERLEIN